MKLLSTILLVSALTAPTAFAKEIKNGTPEHSDLKTWQVGDVVEGRGRVVAKEVNGNVIKVALEDEGMKIRIESSFK